MLAAPPLPHRRSPDARLGPADADGFRVVKHRRRETYHRLGPEESFLLEQFDRPRDADDVRAAFHDRFGNELHPEELDEFIALAASNGLLEEGDGPTPEPAAITPAPAPAPTPAARPVRQQSLLRYRVNLCDPDRAFDALAPQIAFVWSKSFVAIVLLVAAAAGAIVWGSRDSFASAFHHALRWETVAIVWAVLLATTFLHECAHGLTCKRHGGEVHEIGFLLIYLMPSLYCNVSDAWLIPAKRHRLHVTLAGGFSDLLMWSLAVFAWRLTPTEAFGNYLALVVVTVVGTRIALNMNPLIKLDGYYFLSDLLEIPNLQARAQGRLMGWLRHLLWGAARPEPTERGGCLLLYGLASWLFGLIFLTLTVLAFVRLAADLGGPLAGAAVLAASGVIARALLGALFDGAAQALAGRLGRALVWGVAVAVGVVTIAIGHWPERAGGGFQLRPSVRAEARAVVGGFVSDMLVEEGQRVEVGTLLARLTVPNLETRLVQNRAEQREALARLAMLEAGPRHEEVAALRARVDRSRSWRVLADRDLQRAQTAFADELLQLGRAAQQARREADHAREQFRRSTVLLAGRAVSDDAHREHARRLSQAECQADQADAQERAKRAIGLRDAEAEVVRRERELAEAVSALALLEAGARPEELEAERARLARVREEGSYLEQTKAKLEVRATIAGIVTTPRLAERVGQFLREGEAVCWVEEPAVLEAEIVLPEQEAARVQPGQAVTLKPRDQPRRSLRGVVERIAPRAVRGESAAAGTVTVACRLEDTADGLRPGSSGYARIRCGERPIREVLTDAALRLLRMEFWL